MKDKAIKFIYSTRGVYMFIAIAISMAIKFYSGGTTPLSFFIAGVSHAVVTQIFRIYVVRLYPFCLKLHFCLFLDYPPRGEIHVPIFLAEFFIAIYLLFVK